MAIRSIFRYGSIVAACWPAPGNSEPPSRAFFRIGCTPMPPSVRCVILASAATGLQVRDAFHPEDLAALLLLQMRDTKAGGERIFNAGGGAQNAMSLAQLTACLRPAIRRKPAAAGFERPAIRLALGGDGFAPGAAALRLEARGARSSSILEEIARTCSHAIRNGWTCAKGMNEAELLRLTSRKKPAHSSSIDGGDSGARRRRMHPFHGGAPRSRTAPEQRPARNHRRGRRQHRPHLRRFCRRPARSDTGAAAR